LRTDKETQTLLEKAREARAALLKTEDIDVGAFDDIITGNSDEDAAVDEHATYMKDDKPQGPVLSLKLRTESLKKVLQMFNFQ
jgi:hypothetical protein